jgi:hypothetical protein
VSETVEFMTKSKFSKMVDSVVSEKKIPYMDAVLFLCDKHGIDPADTKKYISTVLKQKIEVEAMNLNFLPKTNELPLA